jgi:hypothetical protein
MKNCKMPGYFCICQPASCTLASAAPQAETDKKPELVQAVKAITGTRESLAITYPEGVTIAVKFQGTQRLPFSTGEAKVERKRGTTEIEIELDEVKPASLFGGDYNTYVLWTVSPEGHNQRWRVHCAWQPFETKRHHDA